MRYNFFIAFRIATHKKGGIARVVIMLSLVATILSVAVMVLAMGVLAGFKFSVSQKVYNFWGHIRVDELNDKANYFSQNTLLRDSALQVRAFLEAQKEVQNVVAYGNKYGILLSDTSLEGVIFKGYDPSFQEHNFAPFMQRGRWVRDQSREIIISETHANWLHLDTGAFLIANFIEPSSPHRKRKLKVVGIYKTSIEQYDKNFSFVPLSLIRELNAWTKEEIGGYEIFLKDLSTTDKMVERIYEAVPDFWQVQATADIFPAIFEWLGLLDMNQYIVIVIMFIVAVMNMSTCIVTLVMDRVRMIAILKTLGASNLSIQRIFLYYASFIAIVGIALGNIIALFIGWVQNKYEWLHLKESSYLVEKLHLIFHPSHLLLLDLIIFLFCYITLLLPSALVYRQRIIRAFHF